MDVMTLLLFVGVIFVTSAICAFAWTVEQGSFDHHERLPLLPLDQNEGRGN